MMLNDGRVWASTALRASTAPTWTATLRSTPPTSGPRLATRTSWAPRASWPGERAGRQGRGLGRRQGRRGWGRRGCRGKCVQPGKGWAVQGAGPGLWTAWRAVVGVLAVNSGGGIYMVVVWRGMRMSAVRSPQCMKQFPRNSTSTSSTYHDLAFLASCLTIFSAAAPFPPTPHVVIRRAGLIVVLLALGVNLIVSTSQLGQ